MVLFPYSMCNVFKYFYGQFRIGYGLPIDSKKETPDQLRRMVDNGMLKKISSVYYTNTSKLGEVLMETMLKEVSEFCKPDVQQNWAAQEHQQVFL